MSLFFSVLLGHFRKEDFEHDLPEACRCRTARRSPGVGRSKEFILRTESSFPRLSYLSGLAPLTCRPHAARQLSARSLHVAHMPMADEPEVHQLSPGSDGFARYWSNLDLAQSHNCLPEFGHPEIEQLEAYLADADHMLINVGPNTVNLGPCVNIDPSRSKPNQHRTNDGERLPNSTKFGEPWTQELCALEWEKAAH